MSFFKERQDKVMKRLLCFISLGIMLSVNSYLFAQVVPEKREIKLEVEPGKKTVQSITVENVFGEVVTIKAYLEDFEYQPTYNGTIDFKPLGSTPRSCGKWFSISPELFVVPSKAKQTITYSIDVPQEAKGDYYAVLFFEKSAPPGAMNYTGLNLVTRTGVKIILETPDKVRKATIQGIAINKSAIEGYLLNSGNVIEIGNATFYIMDKESIVSDRGDIQKVYLPAGEKVPFAIKISKKVPQGEHTLFINFDLSDGKALIKEVDFLKGETGIIKILKIRD